MAAKKNARRSVTRNMPRLTMRGAFVPSSVDAEARTVDLVWSTGARVMRGFFDPFWEELSLDPKHVRMGRLQNGAPLLAAHNGNELDAVLGVVESARIEKEQGLARVRFARAEDDAEADKVFRKVQDGILRNVSVGYSVHRFEKVEGGEDQIPVYRATDWEPYELSIVPMGADAGAGVRAAGADTNPCEFIELAHQERAMDEDENEKRAEDESEDASDPGDEESTDADDAGEDSDGTDSDTSEDAGAAGERSALVADRARSAEILRMTRALGLPVEFAQRHINSGTAIAKFASRAIDEREKRSQPKTAASGRVSAVPGGDAKDKWLRGAESWLLTRAGVANTVARAAEKRGEKLRVDPGEFRGMSMVDLAREALERSGINTRGMSKMKLVGMALTQRGTGGLAATGDFPVLLENVMNKTLLGAYDTTQDTWSLFCGTGSVSDFRPHPQYRPGSFGRLDQVNEHGEFKNQSIDDGEKESITAATYGNIIGLTRQAIINDDMGAFSQLATSLGRAARLSIEVDVYALLALNSGLGPAMNDGDTLFHNDHNNIGTDSTIGVAALDADRVLMSRQRDPSGNDYLDLRPSILVVSTELGGQARVINESDYDVDPVTTNATNKFMVPNRVAGLFRAIVDTPRITGTRRYLFADPAVVPVIKVVFLEGNQAPYLEMQEGWRVDGVEWKVRADYGVGAVDWRGAVTNDGTP
jgi:HK97 family phage prohead protease